MSYYRTRLPTHWSPIDDYLLPGGMLLRPAGRMSLPTGPGGLLYLDSIFFISSSETPQDHKECLKNWAPFHAFIFNDPHLLPFIETGRAEAEPADTLDNIHASSSDNAYVTNYDDIAKQTYSPDDSQLHVSYLQLHECYEHLPTAQRNLIHLWLFPFDRGIVDFSWQIIPSDYLQIARFVTIFEVLIGHASDCPTNIPCTTCGKVLPPHRTKSEKQWRKEFFGNLPVTPNVRDEYATFIDAAFHEVRHPTVHAAAFPTACYLPQENDLEVYGVARTVNEFKDDRTALWSLIMSVSAIARVLLLNELFGLECFPAPPELKSKRIQAGPPASP